MLGGGKTFHPGRPKNYDEPHSWTQELPYFDFYEPGCPTNGTLEPGSNGYTHSVCPLDGPLTQFFDHQLASHTISAMRLAKAQQTAAAAAAAAAVADEAGLVRPFFLAAGFRRPHLPWQMPKKYWEMFTDESIAPPARRTVPDGMPDIAFTCGDQCAWELENRSRYNFSLTTPVETPLARTLRRAYLASMAFMDAEIGRVLAELDALNFTQSTLVVLHGDHGWGLGEGNFWHKFSNMEHSARVPLLVRAPWLGAAAAGRVVPDLVELVDLFPTMASLALPAGASSVTPVYANGTALPLDGVDFSPLLTATTRVGGAAGGAAGGKQYAFSQFPRCDGGDPKVAAKNYCKSTHNKNIDFMGYSIRGARFRYTAWLPWDGDRLTGKWDEKAPWEGEELYDHDGDDGSSFDAFPKGWKNLASDPAFAADKLRLAAALRAFFE